MSKEDAFAALAATQSAAEALAEVRDRKWHFEKLREYAEALFERGPFKAGDRVRLKVTPVIDSEHSWGWLCAKHFMIEGAMATVRSVDFRDGHFNALVVFDDETWKSERDGQLRPLDEPGLYCMWDTQIERVP